MHSLVAVDKLRDIDVSRDAGQHIGVVPAEMFFIDQEFNHLADRHLGRLSEVFVKTHADVVARRFGAWVFQLDVFPNDEFQLSNQGCFQGGNIDLAIPLTGVTVSNEEEGAACMNAQEQGRAGDELLLSMFPPWTQGGPLLIRPEVSGGATPMLPKKGRKGISTVGPNLATIRWTSRGMIRIRA